MLYCSVVPVFAVFIDKGHDNGILMDIETNVQYTLHDGPPPWLWLWVVDLAFFVFFHSLTHVGKDGGPISFQP
jgi:hypothetical protein